MCIRDRNYIALVDNCGGYDNYEKSVKEVEEKTGMKMCIRDRFCEVNESMKAYGVASHRHKPEIEEQLGYAAGKEIFINFTPHLVPMNRGILATEYATLKKKPDGTLPTYDEIKACLLYTSSGGHLL